MATEHPHHLWTSNPHYRRAYDYPHRRVPVPFLINVIDRDSYELRHWWRHRNVCACQVPACNVNGVFGDPKGSIKAGSEITPDRPLRLVEDS